MRQEDLPSADLLLQFGVWMVCYHGVLSSGLSGAEAAFRADYASDTAMGKLRGMEKAALAREEADAQLKGAKG